MNILIGLGVLTAYAWFTFYDPREGIGMGKAIGLLILVLLFGALLSAMGAQPDFQTME